MIRRLHPRSTALAGLLAVLVLAVSPASSRADTFYSIDTATDALVSIDSATGNVSIIGTPGYSFVSPTLAYLNGVLYSFNQPPCTNATPVLMRIDPITGAGLGSATITSGGNPVIITAMDGLTSDGTKLRVSYRTAGLCGASHNLADLGTNGALSNATSFSSSTVDMDNLAVGPGGQVFAADGVVVSPNNRTDLYAVTPPSTYTLVGSHLNAGNDGYSGSVFTPGGQLWALERTSHRLRQIDPANGQVLQSVTINVTGSMALRGLAYEGNGAVPAQGRSWGAVKSIYR